MSPWLNVASFFPVAPLHGRMDVASGGLRHSWALGTRHFRGPRVNPPQDFQVSISLFIFTQHNVHE